MAPGGAALYVVYRSVMNPEYLANLALSE